MPGADHRAAAGRADCGSLQRGRPPCQGGWSAVLMLLTVPQNAWVCPLSALQEACCARITLPLSALHN